MNCFYSRIRYIILKYAADFFKWARACSFYLIGNRRTLNMISWLAYILDLQSKPKAFSSKRQHYTPKEHRGLQVSLAINSQRG